MEKKRIDVLLVEQGFFDSREKAKRAVMAGIVHNDHEIIDKPGTKVPVDMELFVKGTVMPYVSRGGLKLEKALKIFDISMQNRVMVDIGSSTGGFTDCALQKRILDMLPVICLKMGYLILQRLMFLLFL